MTCLGIDTYWLSVDPGVKYYAWALWRGGALLSCDVSEIDLRINPPDVNLLVIEDQEIRPRSRARSGDIIHLAQSAGRIADRYREVYWYQYGHWAGQLSADKVRKRTLKALTEAGRDLILRHSKGDQAHIVEAVGIGLYYLRRVGCSR